VAGLSLPSALFATSSGVFVQGTHSRARQTLRQIRVFDTNCFSIWDTLSYIRTRLRALVLGSVSFAGVRRTAGAALVISAAPDVPERILLLVWSVKALSAFDTRHVSSFAEALRPT
jgi:hypothetical protein